MNLFVLNGKNVIFSVSEEVANLLGANNRIDSTVLPNAIRSTLSPIENEEHQGRKWAIVSRLEAEKTSAILAFLRIAPKLDIEQVIIYGGGSDYEYLRYESQSIEGTQFVFKGVVANIIEELKNGKYEGVAGIGRAALEAMSLNIPVMLLSTSTKLMHQDAAKKTIQCDTMNYCGIKGLVDRYLFKQASFSNMSGRMLSDKTISQLIDQVSELRRNRSVFQLYKLYRNEYDFLLCWSQYVNWLSTQNSNKNSLKKMFWGFAANISLNSIKFVLFMRMKSGYFITELRRIFKIVIHK